MTASVLRGFLQLDSLGNIKIDSNGCVNCIIEDGRQLKFLKKINFSSDTINFFFDGTQICVDLPKTRKDTYNNKQQNQNNENVQNHQNDEDDGSSQNDENDKDDRNCQNNQNGDTDQNNSNGTAINTTSSWFWNDASTKLLLDIYKDMKDLVTRRKIKTYKILWKHIAQKMNLNDYPVTSLQVENKIKSLERSYKNMISNNKKTGRARKTCKYEAELTDLLGEKHSIQPLAISGRNGLIVREQLHSNKENNTAMSNVTDNEDFENNPGTSNSLEPAEYVQTLRTDELQTHQSRIRQNTTSSYINKCQAVLDTYISERSNEKQRNENIQMQILQEFKNITKTQEDFVNSAKKQWAISNAKRDENIKVLKEIAKNIEQIVTFPFSTKV